MPAEKSIAQALSLILEKYSDLGRTILLLRFRLDILESDNFMIFLLDTEDQPVFQIESGYGTSYDREPFVLGSHIFRLSQAKILFREKFFLPALDEFVNEVEFIARPDEIIDFNFERDAFTFNLIAISNERGLLESVSFAIHPKDNEIPDINHLPYQITKPRKLK